MQKREKSIFNVKVVPNSSRNEIVSLEDGSFKVYLKVVPEKGKANMALIALFKKELGLKVSIVSGERSRKKRLRVF